MINTPRKPVEITPETDQKMREIVNQIYDRMFDDLKNGKLKFKKEAKKASFMPKERVIVDRNTT